VEGNNTDGVFTVHWTRTGPKYIKGPLQLHNTTKWGPVGRGLCRSDLRTIAAQVADQSRKKSRTFQKYDPKETTQGRARSRNKEERSPTNRTFIIINNNFDKFAQRCRGMSRKVAKLRTKSRNVARATVATFRLRIGLGRKQHGTCLGAMSLIHV
jgi:hypothetical protein